MILRNAKGKQVTRQLKSKSLEVVNDGDKSLSVFVHPKDVKGTVFLSHTHIEGMDDQWLYLPALKRVKRIASNNRSGPLWGVSLHMKTLPSQELEHFDYQLIEEGPCRDGQKCYVLERFPRNENSGYSRQVLLVDTRHYRILKIDYFDRKAQLLKTLLKKKYRRYGAFWRSDLWEMKNHQTGKVLSYIGNPDDWTMA